MKNKKLQTLKQLMQFVKPYKLYFILGLIFSLISVLSSLYSAVLIGRAVDCIIGVNQVDFTTLIKQIVLVGIFIAVIFIAEYLGKVFTQKIAYKTVRDLRNYCLRNLEKVPIKYIDGNNKGDILSRVIADATEVSDGLLMGFTQLFNGVVTILATLIIMLILSYKIALVVVLITPLSLFVASYISKISSVQFKEQAEKRGKLTSLIDEMIGSQKAVKIFSQEEINEEKFESINQDLKVCGTKATFFSALTNPSTRFVNNIVYIAVGIIGALTVLATPESFTIGILTSFLMYANKYTKPFNEISGVFTELQSAIVSADRLLEVINTQTEIKDRDKAVVLRNVNGDVTIKDVDFSYNKDVELIKNLNLNVKGGQRIAIVGPTGSGKTTIINLLMRFYEVDSGDIFVDDKNIQNIKRNSLRNNFGMVLQDTWLKTGTIKQNIAYGNPKTSEKRIKEAGKNAFADSFIMRLPNGYDTVISDENCEISQGQKQLLCIARVMLDLPPMLILDEATSQIDTRTEIKVQKAFDAMMKGRTTFVVAHRLSTIKEADQIIVMNNGHIVETGTHKSLLNKKGFYYDLYNSQFALV